MQSLLHQQMWLWGRDIRGTPNALIDFGFTRVRNPEQTRSRYELVRDGQKVCLWAFGIALQTEQQAVFLHRYERGPRLVKRSGVLSALFQPDRLPRLDRPLNVDERRLCLRGTRTLIALIATYEAHILRTRGRDYRVSTLQGWEHPVAAADQMAVAWRTLLQNVPR